MNLKLNLSVCFVVLLQFSGIYSEEFVCLALGRFPNPASVDCRSYYSCSLTTNNVLVGTLLTCPASTIFNGLEKKCVVASTYTCPNAVTSTTPESSTELTSTEHSNGFTCPSQGRFPNSGSIDCRTYYSCSLVSGNLVATLLPCPASTIFNEDTNKCVVATTYTCPNGVSPSTTESSTELTSTEYPQGFTCPSQGRFPNVESTDCRTYYTCVMAENNLVATLLPCPASTIFHWSEAKCVVPSSYVCPNAVTSTTTSTTTPEPTTTTTIAPGQFACSTPGRFPNPELSDCQTYKYCLQTAATTFLEYTFRCPIGSNFSPEEARCSVSYVCQKEPTTTTTTVATTTIAVPFECDAEGRYPVPESCSQYIFCSRTIDGNFLRYVFKCPPNSWFNPMESKCSASYNCI